MNYTIEEYPELENIIEKLELDFNNRLFFLPENIRDAVATSEYVYPETTVDLKKILKSNNIAVGYLTDEKPLLRTTKSADWFGPTLFIGFSLLTENSSLINISLSLISSYLYDLFKGTNNGKKVKFDIVIENRKKKEFKKISYEGSIDGIKELENVIKALKQ